MSEPRTARTRLRLVFGMPTRNTDFQIWELTTPSWIARTFMFLRCHATTSYLDKRLRVRPLAPFLVELLRLIDDDLAVGHIDVDLRALQRTRRRSFEVDS